MNQTGRIGSQAIVAWAFGSIVGYTLANTNWTPHLGLGVDAASGIATRTTSGSRRLIRCFPTDIFSPAIPAT